MDHGAWMAAAAEEYRRLDLLLRDLAPHEWAMPTDCTEWDVRQVVAHLVGAAESNASLREMARQARLARRARPGADLIDGMNQVQVAERADRTPAELVEDLADAGRRGVAARTRVPGPLRRLRVPFGPPLGTKPLGYLIDRIYTRDQWLHRIDICRATGRPARLTTEHDGAIVADVVTEWAALHGQAVTLVLTGPAGGRFDIGSGGPSLELDAVEFCRVLSGRVPGEGLLATRVDF